MSERTKTPPTLDALRNRRDEILALAEQHGATHVRVFGSVARGEATADSDVDLLVQLQTGMNNYDLSGLRQDLQALLECDVHLVPDHGGLRERLRRWARGGTVSL